MKKHYMKPLIKLHIWIVDGKLLLLKTKTTYVFTWKAKGQ